MGADATSSSFIQAMTALAVVPDHTMGTPWTWRPGGETLEVRDAFYRSLEAEMAQLGVVDSSRPWSEPAIAAAQADRALGDLLGLLAGQDDELLDVDHTPGQWSLREVLGHMLKSELSFASNTRWALGRGESDPVRIPEELRAAESHASVEGTVTDLMERLSAARRASDVEVERLQPPQLELPTVWADHAVDVRFRLHRFASHLIEHTIQVEKVLAALRHNPGEARQVVRAIWAARGAHQRRSEAADLGRLDSQLADRLPRTYRP
ncbi:MAG: DinB family protein [Candidatus Dormibacteria bacterium]